jgi:hypothetical protein
VNWLRNKDTISRRRQPVIARVSQCISEKNRPKFSPTDFFCQNLCIPFTVEWSSQKICTTLAIFKNTPFQTTKMRSLD